MEENFITAMGIVRNMTDDQANEYFNTLKHSGDAIYNDLEGSFLFIMFPKRPYIQGLGEYMYVPGNDTADGKDIYFFAYDETTNKVKRSF